MATYPPKEIERDASSHALSAPCARIARVEPCSPFDDAGFEPGCLLTAVDGHPLRDIIDWRWLSADDVIELSYIDLDGEAGVVTLERDEGQPWGVEFDGAVFDSVHTCRNACTFCFMRQLPSGMRPSLSLRDDDFRLSFLSGTFVTFTNLSPADEERIAAQRISPLRFSLQAVSPEVRRRLIGKHAAHGLAAAERLLAAGIELHAQIVLVPEENDGAELARTLSWAYARPGVLSVGIVPLGYTRYQTAFHRSFNDPADARAVIDLVRPFQERAIAERGRTWAFCADEFYRNAFGRRLLDELPPASFYGDFDMFEDGIGIIRSFVDEWDEAASAGLVGETAQTLRQANCCARVIVGEAMEPFFSQLIERAGALDAIRPLVVANRFFGGNVDVTGLLTGGDIADAVRAALEGGAAGEGAGSFGEPVASTVCGDADCSAGPDGLSRPGSARSASGDPTRPAPRQLFFIPSVVLNDDGFLLDDLRMEDVEKRAGAAVRVVSCSPRGYLREIADAARAFAPEKC